MKRLEGKVIAISGGTSGVGKAAAEAFANEGAKVVIGGRDHIKAEETIQKIKEKGGDALFVHTELRDVEDCKKLILQTVEHYGKIDGLFNYAGVTPISALDSCDVDTFNDVMNINFRASFFCCQEAILQMRKIGGGSIVLTGSMHAWGGEKDRAAYACSKGALLTLMEHIANNYANEQIRCNYLTLGWLPTEGELALRSQYGETEEQLRSRAAGYIPMGRMQEPYDYIEILIYLMSDESKMMTGSTLKVAGGLRF